MPDLTWGLDVSTDKAKTAAVALDWSTPGEARVMDVSRPLRADDIAPLISEHGTGANRQVGMAVLDRVTRLLAGRLPELRTGVR